MFFIPDASLATPNWARQEVWHQVFQQHKICCFFLSAIARKHAESKPSLLLYGEPILLSIVHLFFIFKLTQAVIIKLQRQRFSASFLIIVHFSNSFCFPSLFPSLTVGFSQVLGSLLSLQNRWEPQTSPHSHYRIYRFRLCCKNFGLRIAAFGEWFSQGQTLGLWSFAQALIKLPSAIVCEPTCAIGQGFVLLLRRSP